MNRISLIMLTFGELLLLTYSPLFAQGLSKQDEYKNSLGLHAGAFALEGLIEESGFAFSYNYLRKIGKHLFVGLSQGVLLQDNFPANYYTTNTAPFHLAPEVDAYIRSLTWAQAFNFEWTKSTIVFLVPHVRINFLHYKQFSLAVKAGIGVQYRNYTRFGLVSIRTVQSQIVDYQERITTNTAITPMANAAIIFSQALTPTVALHLNFGYTYELANQGNLKNYGPGDYMALQLGLSKKF